LQKGFAILRVQEQLFVGRQAGAVCEQHTQSDFAAVRVIISEFGNDGRDGSFEIEQAALVENHGHGGRGDDLGERSEIEKTRGCDLGRTRIVCKAADGLVRDEFSTRGDRERTGGKGAGSDGLFEDAESAAKEVILRGEIAR